MSRLFATERRALLFGGIVGPIIIFLVWVGTEVGLRVVTHYMPLALGEYFGYLKSSLLPGCVMGAAIGHASKLSRQGHILKARLMCLGAGAVVSLAYVVVALDDYFQPIYENGWNQASSVTVNGVSIPMWLFRLLNLFLSKNLPFLLAVAMMVIGLLWSGRRMV